MLVRLSDRAISWSRCDDGADIDDLGRGGHRAMCRRWPWLLGCLAVAAPAAWWGVDWWRERRALDFATQALDGGRFAEARPVLAELAGRHPERAEVLYAL